MFNKNRNIELKLKDEEDFQKDDNAAKIIVNEVIQDDSKLWKITKGVLAIAAVGSLGLLCYIIKASITNQSITSDDPWSRVDLDTDFIWEYPWCDGK